MSTTRTNTCKACRREGVSLCGRERCAFKKRGYLPGVHGPKYIRSKPRLSSYGTQLREKQKARRLYNVSERQFQRYMTEASKKRGNTSEFLVQTLESRLDNVVYRLGMAKTRRQARQMVSHKFITVNDVVVNIPSYQVSVGDIVGIAKRKESKKLLQNLGEAITKHETVSWMVMDPKTLKGKITADPIGDDLKQIFDPTLIVEFYSR